MIVIAKGNIFWDGPIQSISNQTIHTIIIQRLTFFPSQKHFKILLSFHCQRLTMFVFLLCHISVANMVGKKRTQWNRIGWQADGRVQLLRWKIYYLSCTVKLTNPLNWLCVSWFGAHGCSAHLLPTVYWVECLGSSALAIHLNLVTYLNYAWLWRKFHISPHSSAKLQK